MAKSGHFGWRFGVEKVAAPVSAKGRQDSAEDIPKGFKDSAWGFKPQDRSNPRTRPEWAADSPSPNLIRYPVTVNPFYRPYRADHLVVRVPWVKTPGSVLKSLRDKSSAESCCPFGANAPPGRVPTLAFVAGFPARSR